MFILILLNVQTKHCVHFNIILSKIWVNMRKKQIVNAKPKNEHTILNNFFRPLHIFPMLLGHQETLPKHSHHSSSQSIQFPENRHICLKTGQVISFLWNEPNYSISFSYYVLHAKDKKFHDIESVLMLGNQV